MPRLTFSFLRLCLALLVALPALAQTVRWDPAGGTLARDQVSALSLVFQDCEPKGTPRLPQVDGLKFDGPEVARSSNISIINGRATRESLVSLNYAVSPTRDTGELTIPTFEVETDLGKLRVPAARFTLAQATLGNSGTPLSDLSKAALALPTGSVWAGEVFPVSYTLNVRADVFHSLPALPEWAPAELAIEPWAQPTRQDLNLGNRPTTVINTTTRALAATPGTLPLPPMRQVVNLQTGVNGFSFFAQPQIEQRIVNASAEPLTVKALPPAPADFSGAVGQFKLTGQVVPQTATVGEPITWTLSLAGTGNWPALNALPAREASRDFRVINPTAKKLPDGDKLFDATLTEDIVLVPTRPGRYTLGPVAFSVFDPTAGTYTTLSSPAVTVEITPTATSTAATPTTGGNTAPTSDVTSAAAPATPASPLATPLAPAALPGDLLLGKMSASTPWPLAPLLGLVASVLALPLIVWLVCAGRHAAQHDPLRPRRLALARLRATLARLAADARPADLRAWQLDAATVLDLRTGAPSCRDLPDTSWATLWTESERALYRPDTPLPADWHTRAQAAAANLKLPAFAPTSALRRRHLWPRELAAALAGLAAASLLSPAPSARAATADESYRAGDYAAAEAGWRELLGRDPLFTSARHNLALALGQQGRWDEAAAHAFVAAMSAPERVRLHALARARAGHTLGSDPWAGAPAADWLARQAAPLVRRASPHTWQVRGLLAAGLIALGLSAWLVARYRSPSTGRRSLATLGGLVLLCGVLGFLVSAVGLHGWRTLLAPETVIVHSATQLHSIPSDLTAEQERTPLAASTVAQVDKTFLDWRRLRFPDGQTGWVRAEALVGLWRAP
jgi:hypothetical protein